MQMICDGTCRPLQEIINSTGANNSSTFSALAIVIENRKLEVIKIKAREEKERLVIHVADQTCQLFKFTFWGQAAVHASSKFSPGSIILLDQFTAKSRHTNVIEGCFGDNTTTHLLYNKFGMAFEEERFPILFKLCIELVKFSYARYQLFYINYAEDKGRTLLSQMLSGSQQQEHEHAGTATSVGMETYSCSQAADTAKSSCHQDTEQFFSPLLSGAQALSGEGEKNIIPFRHMNTTIPAAPTTTVPIKTFEDLRNNIAPHRHRNNQNTSLRIDKDLKIKIQDILVHDAAHRTVTCLSEQFKNTNQNHWSTANISSKWKVQDARTNDYISLCFESKSEAYIRAMAIFDFRDGDVFDLHVLAHTTSTLLVQATDLLIVREAGRSLINCHNRLLLGNLHPSFVQELLVSEESSMTKLSSGKRGQQGLTLSSPHLKRLKANIKPLPVDKCKSKKLLFTLQNCYFVGMSLPLTHVCQASSAISVTPLTPFCGNMKCDAFLWQLIDQSVLWSVPPQRIIISRSQQHTDKSSKQLFLSYPSMKYHPLFFFIQQPSEQKVMRLQVDDESVISLLGTIPAPLLVEALLRPHTFASCCPDCLPFLRRVHKDHGIRCSEPSSAADAAESLKQEERALHHILCSAQRIFCSLGSSPVVSCRGSSSTRGSGSSSGKEVDSHQGTVTPARDTTKEEALLQEMIECNESIKRYEESGSSSSDSKLNAVEDEEEVQESLYICGSQEVFSLRVSTTTTTTTTTAAASCTSHQSVSSRPDPVEVSKGKGHSYGGAERRGDMNFSDLISKATSPSTLYFESFL